MNSLFTNEKARMWFTRGFLMILLGVLLTGVSWSRVHATETESASDTTAEEILYIDGTGYVYADENEDSLLIVSLPEHIDTTYTVLSEADGYPVLGFDSLAICEDEVWNSIETLIFEEGITMIADYSCMGMGALKKVVIPSTVTTIGQGAFADCVNLKKVELQKGLTAIGEDAFTNCFALTGIELPRGLKEIGDYAFACSGLKEITLPSTVTTVGKYAFYACRDLVSLDFSNAMKTVSAGVAKYCTALESVSLPTKATSIGKEAFYNCSSLTSVQIPNRVKTIYTYAFANCYSLERVSVGKAVTKITVSAFIGSDQIGKLIFKGQVPPTMGKTLYVPENTLIRVPKGTLEVYKEALASNAYVKKYKIPMNEYSN